MRPCARLQARTTTVGCMPKDQDTPVVLSRIYTKTGDDGTTTLGDFSRTPKTDLRLLLRLRVLRLEARRSCHRLAKAR